MTDTPRQVTGVFKTPTGSAFPNETLTWFRNPRRTGSQGGSVIADQIVSCTTDASGAIDFSLVAGDYLVMIRLTDDDRYFRVVVPDDAGPHDVSTLVGDYPQHGIIEAILQAGADAVSVGAGAHMADMGNPHEVTKAQVGLGNVNNTSDAEKPVSTAQQAALDEISDNIDGLISTTSGATPVVVITDDVGFVVATVSEDRFSIGETDFVIGDGGMYLTDDIGFVSFRVDESGVLYYGSSISDPETAEEAEHRLTGVLTREVTSLAGWRKARGNMLQGISTARILCIGDSNTMGWSVLGSGQHRRQMSYPAMLAKLEGGQNEDGFGKALDGGGSYEAYDDRVTIGAGWTAAGDDSLGGEMWVNASDTSSIEFTPNTAWDTAEVWVALETAASLDIGVPGSQDSHTPATGSIVKLTYSAPSLAQQALQITRVTGAVQVIGWACYNAATPGVVVYETGRAGWRADQAAGTSEFYSPGNAIAAVGADLCLIQFGINECVQSIDPESYRASLEALIDLCAPSDVALVISFTPDVGGSYLWSQYVTAAREVAATSNVPVIDITQRLGDRTTVEADGWNSDGAHPNAAGLAEIAWTAHKLTSR